MLQLLVKLVTVNRPTATKDSEGGISESYTAVYSDVPCSVQPAATKDIQLYAQRQVQITHTFFVAKAMTLKPGDRLAYNSRTFLFQGMRNLIELGRVYAIDALEDLN